LSGAGTIVEREPISHESGSSAVQIGVVPGPTKRVGFGYGQNGWFRLWPNRLALASTTKLALAKKKTSSGSDQKKAWFWLRKKALLRFRSKRVYLRQAFSCLEPVYAVPADLVLSAPLVDCITTVGPARTTIRGIWIEINKTK